LALEPTAGLDYYGPMHVVLHHPRRETQLKGPISVDRLLRQLDLIPETVLVIRGNDLVTEDEVLRDEDTIEIRPVISGG
jgi:sulfur carrier protein